MHINTLNPLNWKKHYLNTSMLCKSTVSRLKYLFKRSCWLTPRSLLLLTPRSLVVDILLGGVKFSNVGMEITPISPILPSNSTSTSVSRASLSVAVSPSVAVGVESNSVAHESDLAFTLWGEGCKLDGVVAREIGVRGVRWAIGLR